VNSPPAAAASATHPRARHPAPDEFATRWSSSRQSGRKRRRTQRHGGGPTNARSVRSVQPSPVKILSGLNFSTPHERKEVTSRTVDSAAAISWILPGGSAGQPEDHATPAMHDVAAASELRVTRRHASPNGTSRSPTKPPATRQHRYPDNGSSSNDIAPVSYVTICGSKQPAYWRAGQSATAPRSSRDGPTRLAHCCRRRIRLDFTQNAINKTLAAPFGARPAPGAPVPASPT